jgi:hypothetical protein
MDPVLNPFSPGAGSPPPELVGRDQVLEQARVLFARAMAGKSEKGLILTGLRGVGKTVLLQEASGLAKKQGMKTLMLEAPEDRSLIHLLLPTLRTLLLDLDRMQGLSEKVKFGLGVLRAFMGTPLVKVNEVQFSLEYNPQVGVADSGVLEADLPKLLESVAEAAVSRESGVALIIDELQYLTAAELSALIVSMHLMQQRKLPFVLVAAGLPTIPALAGEAKSYSERLFHYPSIGPLNREDAFEAVRSPILDQGVSITDEALTQIFDLTNGYPYFLQEWGYVSWNTSAGPVIGLEDVQRATELVVPRLDESFFRVRFDRLTPSERKYLRAMAEIGPRPCKTGEIAEILSRSTSSLGPVRAKLITKGMAYSPAYGEMAFTVPLFDEFLKRIMPLER